MSLDLSRLLGISTAFDLSMFLVDLSSVFDLIQVSGLVHAIGLLQFAELDKVFALIQVL